MKSFRLITLVTIILFLTGCAHSFVRPEKDTLALGKSTQADVEKLAGKPTSQNDNVQLNGEKLKVFTYFYVESAKFWGMIVPQRTLTYSFFNDVMVGDEFNSSFDVDSTLFDSEKLALIKKGQSTMSDVINIMGKPSGEVLYPVIKEKNGRGLVYAYTVTRHAGIFSPTNRNLAVISFDEKNVVTTISFIRNGEEKFKS